VNAVTEILPLFPLGHVLLPAMPLQLHVFEPRYRALLEDVAAAPGGPCFGVVALRSGSEVADPRAKDAEPRVERVGTVAEIVEQEPRADGTSDLLCVGSRRFAIHRLLPRGRPYLRAQVTFLSEDDGVVAPEAVHAVRELLARYDRLLVRLAGRPTGSDLPDDAGMLSYQVAARLPLPPVERQALLTVPTTGERLERLRVVLRREIGLLSGTRSIAVSPAAVRMAAPLN
jgi:Lon protease-like protein